MIFTRVQFQAWGALGGRMRAQRLSKARRKKIAKDAVNARTARKVGRPLGSTSNSKVDITKAIEMYKQGKTLVEIGVVFGVTRERVRQKLKSSGITGINGGRAIKTLLDVENKKEKKRIQQERRALRISRIYGLSPERFHEMCALYGTRTDPKSPFTKYAYQKRNARVRKIGWKLSFCQWWDAWEESGKWEKMGRGQGKYVMARYGDTGAYEVGNVVIIPSVENNSDRDGKKSGLPIGVSKRKHRYVAYKMLHGKSNYIGTFDSVEEASEAYLKFKGKRKARK